MSEIKKIVIFGATGNTGLCSLKAAVDLGLTTTAFVRDAEKVPEELKSKVTTAVGDVLNASDVENAVENQDGVVIALGTRNELAPTTMISEGTKIILSAMEKHNVKRVSACISAFLFWERSKVPERFVPLTEDHERMLQCIKDSNADWIAVLPPHITETPLSGEPVITYDKSGPRRVVSKHVLGQFLVKSLTQEEHFKRVVGICDGPE